MTDLLQGLNNKQKEAVQATRGPLLVRAGAGSGKTRVLTRRIVYLIEHDGINPFNILALTFTNKAANEMKQRINKLLGVENSGVWASTFHSLGIRILKKYASYLDYRRSFTIAGASTQKTITKNIIGRDLNLDTKQYDPNEMHERIEGCKNELITPTEASVEMNTRTNPKNRVFVQVYTRYQTYLHENQEMDFDDLIMLPVILFKKHPEVLAEYQERFKYISVDEYQDTNHAQYVMVKQLADKYHNLCAVGDENQSIYGWRGADIRNIQDFKVDYPEAKIIYMEQNYRSTKNILGAADSLIAHNYEHMSKEAQPWTDDRSGQKVKYIRLQNQRGEAQFIVNEIARLVHTYDYSFDDFAILYRMNAQSRSIEQALLHSGMPYQIIGGHKFFDRKEIQDIIAYLSLLVNPDDSISFERVVNAPKRGIGAGTMNKFRQFANSHHWNLLEATLMLPAVKNKVSKHAQNNLVKFGKLITDLSFKCHREDIRHIVMDTIKESGYKNKLELVKETKHGTTKGNKAGQRLANLSELVSYAREYDDDNENIPISERLSAFLNNIQLESSQDKIKQGKMITLMTIHAAKGLEFPVVFVAGMEDGIFPSKENYQTDSKHGKKVVSWVNPEERRVAYVAFTRAEDMLFLTGAFERFVYGQSETNPVSEFVREISLKYMDEIVPNRTPYGDDAL